MHTLSLGEATRDDFIRKLGRPRFFDLGWAAFRSALQTHPARTASVEVRCKRALIVGAGDAGISVLKELASDPQPSHRAVGFVDDDPRKWGHNIVGLRVLGGIHQLRRVAVETQADEILICIPSASHAQMHEILLASRQSGLPVKSLPSLSEILRTDARGLASRRDLRNPQIEYLLQRDEIRIDSAKTAQLVSGQSVLVTGAGGSIGSELCRQIASANPCRLVLVEKTENSLFYIHRECGELFENSRLKPYLADITDRDRVRSVFRAERPDIIFHAAAHKHVHLLELHPEEAIRNNVLGTRNVASAAIEFGVGRFVNISTDKAVSPQNYLGFSKKLTELCVQELGRDVRNGHTHFCSVRFGNVAGSTASVLRLFGEQIQRGRPIRVTDPRATRYFMSVPEAVHLIVRAAALAPGGETFVLDMGEPLNIYELAKAMALFSGLKPHVDIDIEFTGLQEGEKIEEALWEDWERPMPCADEHIFEVRQRDHRANRVLEKIARMERLLYANDRPGLLRLIDQMFPVLRRKPQPEQSPLALAASA